MFILEQYFTSKLSAAVREAFNNVYPDIVLNKTTTHQVMMKSLDTKSVCDKFHPADKTDEIMAVLIPSSALDTTIGNDH